MKNNTRDLLSFLFGESQDGGGTATDVTAGKNPPGGDVHKPKAPGKDAKLAPAKERESIESHKSELTGILTKLGLKDVDSRLEYATGEFWLSGDKETHAADTQILGDISKIEPLVDKGYVVVDGEIDQDNKYKYAFICTDSFNELDAEGGVSDVEGMDTIDSIKPMAKEESDELAHKLIQSVLKEASEVK